MINFALIFDFQPDYCSSHWLHFMFIVMYLDFEVKIVLHLFTVTGLSFRILLVNNLNIS